MKTPTDHRALLPASTRTQSRVALFQPTKRPTRRTGEWQSSADGKRRVRVTGRLGQRHADVLEAICFTALARRDIEDGGLELIVDPYRIRRCVGAARGKWGAYSKEQVLVLLADRPEQDRGSHQQAGVGRAGRTLRHRAKRGSSNS